MALQIGVSIDEGTQLVTQGPSELVGHALLAADGDGSALTGVIAASAEATGSTDITLTTDTGKVTINPGTPTTEAKGLWFGDDVALYRSAANVLTTPDTVEALTGFRIFTDVILSRPTGNTMGLRGSNGIRLHSPYLAFGNNVNTLDPTYPGLYRDGTGIRVRLADDSADTDLHAGNLTASSMVRVGGTTTAFNALKSNGAGTLLVRLGDDSALAPLQASTLTASGSITSSSGLSSFGRISSAVQSLSGPGAVNVTQGITAVTSTGTADALTLADGTSGLQKTIVHSVDGGDWVLTATTPLGWSSITSADAGDSVSLVFISGAGWAVTGSHGVTVNP